jgi:hypothetical protein
MNRLYKHTTRLAFLCLLLLPTHYVYSAQLLSHQPFNTNTSIAMTPVPTFTLVGTAHMKWLWLDIYQATVLTSTGTYKPNQWPLSLNLLYKRSITAEQLIQSTLDEWARQSINYNDQWLSKLGDIWPDVAPQDEIILYVDKVGISHFFYNSQFIGTIQDPLFAPAFTAIWLSDNTLKPALRDQLIGLKP